MKHRIVLGPVLLAGFVLATGCARQPIATAGATGGPRPSAKLNPFAYYEQGEALFLGVDTRAARYAKERPLLPLGLGLANHGRGIVRFTRESFTLEAPDGTRFPVVSHEEYLRVYKHSREDMRLADVFNDSLEEHLVNYQPVRWSLFPVAGGPGIVNDKVELAKFTRTETYVYFPQPPGGARGPGYRLLVTSPDLVETFVVTFALE